MNISIDYLVAGMHRVSNFFYKHSLRKVVLDMQDGSTEAYRKMIQDAGFSFEASFEREIVRQLNNGGRLGMMPAEMLLPVMMSQFGVARNDFIDTDPSQLEALEAACNHCPVVGDCWKSMRSGASTAEALSFCPSADIFERCGNDKVKV
ncbi:hypothetical protein HNO52_05275 [Billgrantia diversa]|uniref:hypothetical protein n=1 Tax=Halomonas sp. MCCC 1A13316 TaxID=2733487 RepID=UPI0018A593FA|nr:hypothetical protein [Halomonas sp. MCCC 1A13316]QOR37982.1 hypothetical protein HNO52_05275 [Halomonas sp. MCCC 1A13316]